MVVLNDSEKNLLHLLVEERIEYLKSRESAFQRRFDETQDKAFLIEANNCETERLEFQDIFYKLA